jgi:hypothetical protein
MYSLAVDVVHTYYVVSGGMAILVHNESCSMNKKVGDAYRDHIVDFFRQRGLTVITEEDDAGAVTFDTPDGARVYDMVVFDANGEPNYIEVSLAMKARKPDQAKKDMYLESQYGITIDYVFDELPNIAY